MLFKLNPRSFTLPLITIFFSLLDPSPRDYPQNLKEEKNTFLIHGLFGSSCKRLHFMFIPSGAIRIRFNPQIYKFYSDLYLVDQNTRLEIIRAHYHNFYLINIYIIL